MEDKKPAIGQAPRPAVPVVLYIDQQRLLRDCIGGGLASRLPDLLIHSVASIREVEFGENWSEVSLIILHGHGAGLDAPEIAEEREAIRQLAPGVPLLFMSDIDDVMEVHMAMQFEARG